MPKYEYECPGDCEIIELEFSIFDVPKTPKCSTCGAKLFRVYTPTPAIFNGRGWGSKP
jgi:predicted nucleic acid-binding Zn ribbon protein